jgi:hypothetical protein
MKPEARAKLTYGAGGTPLVGIALVWWLIDHGIWSNPPDWLKNAPWSVVTALFVGLVAGQLLADWRNDKSPLREWWRRRRRLFDVIRVFPPGWIMVSVLSGVSVTLKFVKPVPQATILLHLIGTAPKTLVVKRNMQIAIGEEVRVPLLAGPEAKVVIEPAQMRWNPDGEEWTAHWGYEYVVTVEVQANARLRQMHKVYIRLPQRNAPNACLVVFHEGRDIFDENAISNYSGGYGSG